MVKITNIRSMVRYQYTGCIEQPYKINKIQLNTETMLETIAAILQQCPIKEMNYKYDPYIKRLKPKGIRAMSSASK